MPPPTTNGRQELVPANVFVVRIPGIEIGYFHECSGLSIEVEVFEYPEGGNNEFVHQLPGRLRYPKLTLKRGLTREDNLLKWFWATRTQAERKELIIEIYDTKGEVHRSWTFDSAYPVSWTGPTIVTGSTEAATETLEIAHSGLKMA